MTGVVELTIRSRPSHIGFPGPSIAAAFPMAYLFERGDNTIWAPVVLHVATHMIRLVDISPSQYRTAVAIWLLLQIGMVFLVYLFLNNLLREEPKNETR